MANALPKTAGRGDVAVPSPITLNAPMTSISAAQLVRSFGQRGLARRKSRLMRYLDSQMR
jgi:hypothetical protein